ncbi:HNH endonuclease [Pelagicoccus enzymogenes]|uniref:HNH endonuclease n=1 Tax=Pelagicoccus enzymogenes TaxID=2773457 RepID=UPI00280DED3F|nr:HNH endonuclease [Pelagicoccus enzymogenes]MDQ8199680.1 HNH endonuclease [Pelagicoccus enzymogenes]
MRKLEKLEKPQVLQDNASTWLSEYKSDKSNSTKKYRYRNSDIKSTLKIETGNKCVYCESKIGHNTPGDIEHKIPSSKFEDLHFEWSNLTIACTECNRRKNDYYVSGEEFLDPYVDDVEDLIEHHGPTVYWKNGNNRAEITVETLEFNSERRITLVIQKIEKIKALNNLLERWNQTSNQSLKTVLGLQIKEMADRTSEFSAMVLSVLDKKGVSIDRIHQTL